ncbi:TetR/AcrR family transcriptional regulator [Lysinibacillus xylanilyticus]|uniref:TetR/AcrR family transcriptional regulator n=1 Tax=Lysinibacillus xylanilyticus TaxID=582475 RepID=UPI002B24604F|nr:TetR/AcrR family transcriptional regulator [Lysinibacillus xylanilyticus]MEB2299030.1 TetR/AcrR family transcriptional regulator [Lysinibacillus xylanilyticus]
MARNNHPEKTIQQILSISYRLFLEKGYEQTTIQDIINELGMSKGAIYHHFKSKEEILQAISDNGNYLNTSELFKDLDHLNALQKLKKIICNEFENLEKQQFNKGAISLAENPKFVSALLNGTMKYGVPVFQSLIEEGKKDGSISVEDSKSASEIILLLNNVWLCPMLGEVNEEDLERKILYLKKLTELMGIPFMDEEVVQAINSYLKSIFK